MSESFSLRCSINTYFFTLRLQDQTSDLLIREVDLLRTATRLSMKRWPFEIDAAVILPNRLHMIWRLPQGDTDFSKRWRLIKSTFSRHCDPPRFIPPSSARRGDKGIWQRRFWEHLIKDEADLQIHRHLIASAPVHAGLVKRPGDWPYSSVQRRKADGLYNIKTTDLAPSVLGPAIVATAS